MILLKLLVNIAVIVWGLSHILGGKREIQRRWYPKWIGIGDIVVGVILIIWSFSIWFIVEV